MKKKGESTFALILTVACSLIALVESSLTPKVETKIIKNKDGKTQYITIPARVVQDSQYPFKANDVAEVEIEHQGKETACAIASTKVNCLRVVEEAYSSRASSPSLPPVQSPRLWNPSGDTHLVW